MKRDTRISLIGEILVALIGLVLFYAAISKLLEPWVFWRQLLRQPFPDWMAHLLVVFLPLSELLVCIALAIPSWRRAGLISATALMAIFSGYIGFGLLGLLGEVPCVCGGLLSQWMDWSMHLVFNIIVLGISVTALLVYKRKEVYVENG